LRNVVTRESTGTPLADKCADPLSERGVFHPLVRADLDTSKFFRQYKKTSIFYFDKDNSHKDLKNLIEYFEGHEYSVYMREVKYGLNDEDFIYEIHIVN